ncbi:hypothetical protein ACWT_4442 [Actinoplanes sp. SE50]|nr:hypothetical protein ACPL_4573 [Actinoplanes sp. SE50/110]ATO83857.1 hypothetical protein ACWT_4442 [Actinoplanes sp. SE50]SLM01267.1 hypothetical protein ACSP50_4503 [Actinoplanes sp. SE50/110]
MPEARVTLPTMDSGISDDGTVITFRTVGTGPGLVVPGSNRRAHHYDRLAALPAGSRTPPYLRDILPPLARLIPGAGYEILPGLDHNAPDRNAPETIPARLTAFLHPMIAAYAPPPPAAEPLDPATVHPPRDR